MYDETYGVIYEVITRKLRASLEPFWGLKISKYVEYLTRVSSEYITSWALLSLRSTVGWTSHVFLAYVMPWINKASLALYIARGAGPRATAAAWPTWSSEGILCCRVRLCDWSIETCRYLGWESILDAISMISGASIDWCVRILLTTFYHMNHYTMQLLGRWSRVHSYIIGIGNSSHVLVVQSMSLWSTRKTAKIHQKSQNWFSNTSDNRLLNRWMRPSANRV